MLTSALALSVVITSGLAYAYGKLPRKMRRFLDSHMLLSDVIALLLTFMVFGAGLTALFAGILVGALTNCLLYIANNPNDFLFLSDFRDYLKARIGELKAGIKDFSLGYNQAHGKPRAIGDVT